jgi:hypothetical protein
MLVYGVATYIMVMLGIIIFLKVRARGKIKVVVMKPSGHYHVRAVRTEGNKLKMSKKWIPTFKPQDIFEERKALWKFWRNPLRLVFIVEDAMESLSWKDQSEGEFSELASMFTEKEVKKIIKREVARAMTSVKPINFSMFLLLMLPQIIMLFLVVMIANRMGIF